MESEEFIRLRKELNKTQKEVSQLLGTSLKAVRSYEQGWRNVPTHVERQFLFLKSRKNKALDDTKQCWEIRKCPSENRDKCPAWEFKCGSFCWFINGTVCEGTVRKDWPEKMKICRSCRVFKAIMKQK